MSLLVQDRPTLHADPADSASTTTGNAKEPEKQAEPKQQNSLPHKPVLRYPLPKLPQLSWEWGYKYAPDPESGELIETPLTLLDLLYPTGEELFMAEGWFHRWLSVMLEVLLRQHLKARKWIVFGNIFVHWNRPGVPPLAPDVTAIFGGDYPGEDGSYHVGDDGPNPSFVVEITSPNKPGRDLERKKWDYAALAIPEYLIVDMWSEPKKPWKLYGYRLEHDPFYHEIKPDAEGGLTFETVGLRFVGVGRTTVDVYDATNGEKLALPDDWMGMVQAEAEARAAAEARAEAEAKRAEAEAKRAEAAETELAEARARLRELEARLDGAEDGDEDEDA